MPCEGISSTSMNCSQQSWVDGSATISKAARKAAADARISQQKLELQQQCAFVTGTAFMRKLVDKLQRNYAAKLTEFHNCLATHFFHTYVRLHLNTPKDNGINVEDVAACAFWLALKSEQTVDGYACPLDTLVDVWHRVKLTNPWMDKNVPREHCDQFCAYFIQLERLLLCSNGFGFYVEFPHWLVLLTVPGLTGSDSKEDELLAASYYLCSDCLQMTMFGCEETPALMASACTILAAFWLDHQLWQLPGLICQAFEQTANQNVRKASPAKSRLQQLQGQTNNAGIECGGGGEVSVNLAQAKYYASVLAQTHAAISAQDSPSILLKKMIRKPSRYGQIPFPASASALSPLSRLDTVSSPSCTSASSSGGCGGGGGTTTTNDSRSIGIGSNQGNWVDSGIEA